MMLCLININDIINEVKRRCRSETYGPTTEILDAIPTKVI